MLKISIAVSSHGNENFKERLVQSLARQTHGSQLEILVGYTNTGATVAQVRNQLYAQAQGNYVLFLDEDCELPSSHFISDLCCALKEGTVIGGGYLSATQSPWQEAYNRLVNYWLELHSHLNQPVVVAGNFILPKLKGEGLNFPFEMNSAFGGEEVALRRVLVERGLSIQYDPRFSVLHNGERTARAFLQRAWLHGRSPKLPVKTQFAARRFLHYIRGLEDKFLAFRMALYLGVVWIARWT